MFHFVKPLVFMMASALLLGAGYSASAEHEDSSIYAESRCGPPVSGWRPQGSESGELMWFNLIVMNADQLAWNDTVMDRASLQNMIVEAAQNSSGAFVLVIDPSSYCSQVEIIRQMVIEHLRCGPERICVEYMKQEWETYEPPPVLDKKR